MMHSHLVDADRFRTREEDVVAMLRRRIDAAGDGVACSRIERVGDRLEARPLSLAELSRRVSGARRSLVDAGVAFGDRVALMLDDPHDFLTWFIAVVSEGAIAVPLPRLGARTPRSFEERVRGVWTDCHPVAIVTWTGQDQPDPLSGALVDETMVLDAASARRRQPTGDPWAGGRRALSDVALLQYTSGSTSRPKGVVVTHGNLSANMRASRQALGFSTHDTMISWLPLHHDMGLIGGLLLPVCSGMGSHVMTTRQFVRGPLDWLRSISALGGTVSVAPCSAYGLCARYAPESKVAALDLSCWRLAIVGAEAVDADVLARFAARFASAGLRGGALMPVYGLAEATLAVALPPSGRPPRRDTVDRNELRRTGRAHARGDRSAPTATFVSVGAAIPGHRVRVVEPDGTRECGEREVGEIVFSGPSTSPGYFGEESESRTELRTGDLGYIAAGELHIVDRIKDMVIIAGQNYYPTDLEAALAPLSDVPGGRVAAFAVRTRHGADGLAVAIEVSDEARGRRSDLQRRIVAIVHEQFGLTPSAVVALPPKALPRTTSGKLQRQRMRQLFEAGLLGPPPIPDALVGPNRAAVGTAPR